MKVFCWDFDGTLAYCDHLWSGSVYKAILDTVPDSAVEFAAIRRCNQSGFSWQSPEKVYPDRTGELWWEDMNRHFYKSCLSLGLTHEQSKAVSRKVRGIIMQPENYFLFEGAQEILACVKLCGHKNILVSNNYPDLKIITDALGLTQYFERIVVSGAIGYEKPHPKIFETAVSLFPECNEFYMVGDNVNADIVGGNRAGMKTVLVHNGFDELADYCFENLCDIELII